MVYHSQINDVKELKERLLREWRLLDHTVIAAAIAQWCSRLNGMYVFGWIVDILSVNFEPLTFCCVLFVSSILFSVNLIDINMWKVLILCEMCYFCVWDFHTVWWKHSKCMAINFLRQWLWHFLMKLCTKKYENPSIFVKVTAKKSVAPFFWTRCSYNEILIGTYALLKNVISN